MSNSAKGDWKIGRRWEAGWILGRTHSSRRSCRKLLVFSSGHGSASSRNLDRTQPELGDRNKVEEDKKSGRRSEVGRNLDSEAAQQPGFITK